MSDFQIYHQKDFVPGKIQLTLAWKDNKLYIQNNMPFDILIEGVENGVQMLDEERPTLDLDEVDSFSYELPKLESKGSARLSGREILRISVENLQMMGRRQAFIITILLVTAVLLSVTLAQFINIYSIDESSIVTTDSHYVHIDFSGTSSNHSFESTEQLSKFIHGTLTGKTLGDPFFIPNINVYLTGSGYKQLTNLTQMVQNYSFTSTDHLKESDLICGEMPKKRNEVVMDALLAQRLIDTRASVSTLHTTPESYLGMRLVLAAMDQEFTIVGVSNTNQPVIYAGQNVLLGASTKGYPIANVRELQAELPGKYDDFSLKDNEILVRQGLYDSMEMENRKSVIIGDDKEHKYKIAGTFPNDFDVNYVLSDQGCINVRNLLIQEVMEVHLYTENPDATAKTLNEGDMDIGTTYEMEASVPVRDQIKAYREAHSSEVDARQLIPLAVAVISLIMIYFTIKSNASSRSEELTVYRLIGISRGSILKAYMLEMVLVTSYTSLPAVLATSGVIQFIRSIPSLEINMVFPWWSALVLLVCIYAVHAFISILPVYGILSKPPATLAVKE